MLDVFRGLKGLVKAHRVTIDSSIFRLHYSATVTFLLAFSLIVTTRQAGPHSVKGQQDEIWDLSLVFLWSNCPIKGIAG